MELIKQLVRNIAILAVFASFLEMLIPSGDMKRYVRLVMGLFVIAILLNPLMNFLDRDLVINFGLEERKTADTEFESILADGRRIAEENRSAALEKSREALAKQVMAIARMKSGVEVSKVEIEMVDNPEEPDYGTVKKIKITATRDDKKTQGEESSMITPVEINIGENQINTKSANGKVIEEENREQLVQVLADFYGLSTEQIKIVQGR